MKFFGKKGDASASRRRARLWVQRLKAGALYGGGAGAVVGLFVYAWIGGWFSIASSFAVQKTVDISAAAGFKVSDILVVGRRNTAPEELLTRLGISAGDPLFGVSIAKGQTAIADIPWVAEATVARRLPGTVVVTIRERAPAALWQYQKKLSLIDVSGHVLTDRNLDSWRHLPLVVGEHAPQDVATLLGLLHAEPEIAQQLAAAVRIGSRRWDLRLKNGVLVKLPENDVELALRRLALMGTGDGLLARNVKHIDLRLAGRTAIEPVETDNSNI
ncbi:MAG: cell division protein FtsQ/DivIB [Alphaproteobacteria bacterium]